MSDVFDEYCRIMEEKGYIRKDAQESKSPTRVEKETSEDYREKIRALYGLDIKLNDSNKSIVEQAHPETVVVAPSYDRMNGVVENIQERQNVMVGIALKPNNGNLTQHRYAKKELLDELVRLGFDLENEGEEDLANHVTVLAAEFADHKPITKEAFIQGLLLNPWFWRAIGAVGVWGYAKTNFIGYIDQGVRNDTERAIKALQGLKDHVEGPDQALINRYIAAFEKFKEESERALEILSRSPAEDVSVKSSEDILKAKKSIVGTKEEIKFTRKYLKMAAFVADAIGSTSPTRGVLGRSSESDILPTLSRMNVVAKDVESDWWQMTQSFLVNTLGGAVGAGGSSVKTHAINSVSSVRDSILALIRQYKIETTEAASEVEEKAENARDAFAKAIGSDAESIGSEIGSDVGSMGSGKPSAKPE